jgi:hypothetical protein
MIFIYLGSANLPLGEKEDGIGLLSALIFGAVTESSSANLFPLGPLNFRS